MKIALINYDHFDTVIGGVETRYRLLGRALTAAGHECKYVATEAMCLERMIVEVSSCDLAIADSAVGYSTICPMITIFGNAWRGVLSCRPGNTHIESVVHRETLWHRKHQSFRVAVSNYIKEKEMLPNGILADSVVPNPADLSRFPNPVKKDSPRTILWVGPFIDIKNPTVMNEVRDLVDDIYKGQIQWKYACRNDATMRRDYNAMTECMGAASLVLCTSVAEGCSNTMMEAMAADVPIVTTSCGLFWDWWDPRIGVRITANESVAELVAGIQKVLDNPDQFAPRQVALDHKLDYDSWVAKWSKIVEFYSVQL